MKSSELLADLSALAPGQNSPETLLYNRLLLRYLADHVYEAELASGQKLRDASDFNAWLRELADLAAPIPESTKVSWMRRAPAPQSRWEDTCPRCGHVHQGDAECGEQLGGGRICRCEFEAVPA
jgi:hypothetical protein